MATEAVEAAPAVGGETPAPEKVEAAPAGGGETPAPEKVEAAPAVGGEAPAPEKVVEVKVEEAAKKTRSRKRKSGAPQHPPYFEMIKEAILALDGNGKEGSSPYAIAKYMGEKHRDVLPANYRKVLAVQLRGFAAKGRLVKVKASFKLAAAEVKKAAKKKPAVATATAKRKRTPVKPAAAVAGAAPKEARKARGKRARKAAPAPAAQPKPRRPKSARAAAAKKANKASA
ncbi:hypothetical protein ACP4OV_017280 [Aristida adscensionis]